MTDLFGELAGLSGQLALLEEAGARQEAQIAALGEERELLTAELARVTGERDALRAAVCLPDLYGRPIPYGQMVAILDHWIPSIDRLMGHAGSELSTYFVRLRATLRGLAPETGSAPKGESDDD
jgi:hypothetical protein